MKQYVVYVKAGLRGLLLSMGLFLVPGNVLADANVPDVSLVSLEQIEPLINDGPEVMVASAKVVSAEALAEFERQKNGAKYFGGMTFGNSNEPAFDTSEDKLSYNKLILSGGINFPMLGTLQKEKLGKLETETTIIDAKHRSDMLVLNNLIALRKAYTALWIEQQKEKLANRFLSTETETANILESRQAQGLVLPADRLEYLSFFHDVKRDLAASKLQQNQALNVICLATGRKWEESSKLKAPSLPDIDGRIIDVNSQPQVVYQNKLIAQYEKLSKENKRTEREGNLALGLTATRDFPGATGTGAYVAFSMTEPATANGANDQAKLAAAADLDRVKKETTFIRLKLAGQTEEALATADYAAAEVNARASHLIVMAEAIREKMLRQKVLPGDAFEQLQHSKSQYYKTAMEMLEREEQYLDAAIVVVSYIYPGGLNSEAAERFFPINVNDVMVNKLLAPNWLDSINTQDISEPFDFSGMPNLKFPVVSVRAIEKASANSAEKKSAFLLEKAEAGVYVWNAQPFIKSDTREAAINEIAEAGFSRVLISFTPKQISELLLPNGKLELEALLNMAKRKGIRMDIMLGDPTWAEAAHRGELIALLKKLRTFAFAGIHLDIEPDSLPDAAARRPELLKGLADTIKAVKEVTTLPVSISIHPRYLEGELGVLARQKLLGLGLEEVVVMIYSDNPSAVAQRMSAIMAANPYVKFSLAQSVESDIPLTESYATKRGQQFIEAMHLIEGSLANYGLKGIFIQAWEDYKKGETQ
ncbi:MAG: hypothetical protein H6Q74_2170 [Firmicutes bacterium]|nr:hypothetical protein [Bacillota bacterium]